MLFISVVGRCRCHPESTMMTMWRRAIFSFSLHRLLNEHRTKGMMVEIGRDFAVISLHSRESFSGGNNNRCEVVESKEKREKFATLFQVEDLSDCSNWIRAWKSFFFKAFPSFHLVGVRARRRKYGNFFKSFDASTQLGVLSESNWEFFFLRSLIMAWTRERANIANIKGISLVQWFCWMEKKLGGFHYGDHLIWRKFLIRWVSRAFHVWFWMENVSWDLDIHRLNRFRCSKVSIASKHGNSWNSLSWKLEFQQLNWNVGWSLNVLENVPAQILSLNLSCFLSRFYLLTITN